MENKTMGRFGYLAPERKLTKIVISISRFTGCCRMGLHTVIPMGKAQKIVGTHDPRAEARGHSFQHNLLNLL